MTCFLLLSCLAYRHRETADQLYLVTGVSRACCPQKTTTHSMQSQHTLRRSMQCQFTPRNLPRLHSADKSFAFALNYPKYFPKAPGSAAKSFYRQKIEAQWAEGENGEKGRYEVQRRGRNERQQSQGGRGHAVSLQRMDVTALTSRSSNIYRSTVASYNGVWWLLV